MQLPLGSDPRTDLLQRTHSALIAEFGRIERPDTKRRDLVWMLVRGVIGVRTKTTVSNAATFARAMRSVSSRSIALSQGDYTVTTLIRPATPAALLFLAACSQAPSAPPALTESTWTVDSAASTLSYVSIKADQFAETNMFEKLSGSVSAEGAASIEVDLASVKTGVDIRDERMRDVLFVVSENPTANVTAQVDPASFGALGVGESAPAMLEGTLSLNGIEAPFQAETTVTRAGPDRVLVVSDKPVIVEAGQFNLTEGLGKLQELAGLPSITPVAPVTFSITFER